MGRGSFVTTNPATSQLKPHAIGVDVGGTKIAAGLVTRSGEIQHRYTTYAHSEQEPQHVIDAIEEACRAILQESGIPLDEIESIGIGFPGNTDGAHGRVLVCSNLPAWSYVPLARIVAARLGLPVVLDNDCNMAAMAEHRYGAGRGSRNMCYVTISTGYGAGIIVDNKLYAGSVGTAGELGHMVIDPGGPMCTCGKRGCLMTYTSGIGMSRLAYEAIAAGRETLLRDMMPADGRRFSGQVVAQAAANGDAVALEVLDTVGRYAGIGIAMLVQVLNPELIVLGGGLTRIGKPLTEPMLDALHESTQPELWNSIVIRPWQLGDDIGILGAAARVFAEAETLQADMDAITARFVVEKLESSPVIEEIPAAEPLTPSERTRLEAVEGTIFDIQRYSLHDGPGLRTNVFFKGCPLRCDWCSNPESQRSEPEMALFAHNCMVCGQFPTPCPERWREVIEKGWSDELWHEYEERAEKCPTQAVRLIGERQTAGGIMTHVRRDVPFYDDGGGLTLAGGEPTMQPQLAEALLRLAKGEGISTAMETCGHTRWPVLRGLLPYLDHILFDLKHVDSQRHRTHTGVDNALILENLQRLAAAGMPLTLRLPLIPGFNADTESLQAIAEYIVRLGNIEAVDVLPYHTLGKAKYAALGRDYPWEEHSRLTDEEVEALLHRIEYYGLKTHVGG
jgi:glycyl-radical enzyme activating protein/glucokinase-like ROK family protein